MGLTFKYTGPNFRGFSKHIKAAIDVGFENHQKKFIPKHFTSSAPQRYRGAYNKVGAIGNKGESWVQRWARMSPAQKLEMKKFLADRRNLIKKGPNSKIPLVVSGILKRAAVHGAMKFSGPASRRKARIPAPHYLNFHRPGQILKRAAIQAVIPSEVNEFIKIVDAEVQKALNRREVTRKRR